MPLEHDYRIVLGAAAFLLSGIMVLGLAMMQRLQPVPLEGKSFHYDFIISIATSVNNPEPTFSLEMYTAEHQRNDDEIRRQLTSGYSRANSCSDGDDAGGDIGKYPPVESPPSAPAEALVRNDPPAYEDCSSSSGLPSSTHSTKIAKIHEKHQQTNPLSRNHGV